MNRLTARVIRLEHVAPNSWRAWWRVPMRLWPDHALEALVNADQGWPGGYVPTDEELRAIASASAAADEDGGAA